MKYMEIFQVDEKQLVSRQEYKYYILPVMIIVEIISPDLSVLLKNITLSAWIIEE
jgi:hypothetical protein